MLDGWASKGRSAGAAADSPSGSSASEVSHGSGAAARALGSAFEYDRKPAVLAPDQTQLNAIETWLFADDNNNNDHHGHAAGGSGLLGVPAMGYPF